MRGTLRRAAGATGAGRLRSSSRTDGRRPVIAALRRPRFEPVTMPYAELSTVKHRVQAGVELPFNVRDADGTLLLARGHRVESQAQLEALFTRGALVDINELLAAQDPVRTAPRAQLPRLWAGCLNKLSKTLGADPGPGFVGALDDAAAPVQALIQRDPDLAIFQVLRHSAGAVPCRPPSPATSSHSAWAGTPSSARCSSRWR
jgi:hypothetical protein